MGEWVINDTVTPVLNRAARDWHTDHFAELVANEMTCGAAFSQELVLPPDDPPSAVWVQRYPEGDLVQTATGFGSKYSSHCAFAPPFRDYIRHAHHLCRDMKGLAVLPDGTKKRLLWIPDWDFAGQDQYRYETPIRLPGGTRLEMEFTYDNSADNPRNPHHPPRRVVWGPESTDEMAGLHVQAIPERKSDQEELLQALWGKTMRTLGGRVGPRANVRDWPART